MCGRLVVSEQLDFWWWNKPQKKGADTMQYSDELRYSLLRRMLPPSNESITKIARKEGFSEQTLRNWRDKTGTRPVSDQNQTGITQESDRRHVWIRPETCMDQTGVYFFTARMQNMRSGM